MQVHVVIPTKFNQAGKIQFVTTFANPIMKVYTLIILEWLMEQGNSLKLVT